jgi:hypothetical protein
MWYLITKEAMDNQVYFPEENHVYAWATNGHEYNLPIVKDEEVKMTLLGKSVGLIDVTRFGLVECTRNEAFEACWNHGGFRNKWDIYNGCFREDLKDPDNNVIRVHSLEDMVRIHRVKKEVLLKYWKQEGYDVINN